MVATLFEWFYGKSPSDKIFIFGKWAQNGRALGCLWVGEDVSPIASPLHSVQCHKTMMCVSSPSPLCCCHLQQVHWGETHVRDGTLLEFPVKWCVYICIISELTPFSAPRPPNLHDLLPRTRVSWPETESGKRWWWIVGTCDLHLVPWEVTTLRNVVGAGAEKIVWVCRPSAQWHSFAILRILMMLKNLLPTTRIGRFCLFAMWGLDVNPCLILPNNILIPCFSVWDCHIARVKRTWILFFGYFGHFLHKKSALLHI